MDEKTDGRSDGGRVVPNYAVTRGRTRSAGPDLPIEALMTATAHGRAALAGLAPEYRAIVEASSTPRSLAEIGAVLDVPVGVARVLVSDLVESEYLAVHLPLVDADGRPRRELLERLLDGLRAR
ncbi:DUF742 domain-containing protein [Actinomycetospora endophytica]|uniref:DUF742 domain-containing protein n=1 Tax=Actinomycetospora endophytica TaxID=2291215 RepID=A0ABS8PF15_9PSEU|nr:DUF742 domain-containing protein [Actinomycetospora endophytica]MCD2196853.1 DUF742 domain-containing protein [Actinomycetospora endophytica]